MLASKLTNIGFMNVANDSKAVALSVKDNPIYQDNKTTGQFDGKRVEIVLVSNGFEKLAVKVKETDLTNEILQSTEMVWVNFSPDFTAKIYSRDGNALVSASATSCSILKDTKK